MIELAELAVARGDFRQPLLAEIGEPGNAAVRRIDDDRTARDAIDADYFQSRIQPEPVVAADAAAGGFRNLLDERSFARRGEPAGLAAFGRNGAIGVARL